MFPFGKSLRTLRAELALAKARLSEESGRLAGRRAGVDDTLSGLQPLALEIVKLQREVWLRMPRRELESELAALRAGRARVPADDWLELRRFDNDIWQLESHLKDMNFMAQSPMTPLRLLAFAAAVAGAFVVAAAWDSFMQWIQAPG